MDVFIEQIVKKRPSPADTAKKMLIIFGALVIAFLAFTIGFQFLGTFSVFIVAGAFYLAWFLFTSMDVEYEYIVTNEEIDIDRIVARRKRKRVLTVKISNFDSFEKYNPEAHKSRQYQTKIDASATPFGENAHCATFHHPSKGNTLLIFSPNEKVLAAVEPVFKRKVMFKR